MELRHLRYFVAVAELENVSRAALKLHVSQPALSAQIRDLEDELGFDLLERTPKSVRLTIAGRVFLDQARAVLEHVDLAVKSARAAATGGETELHVGYLGTPIAHLLPAILRVFQKSMPNVQVRLHEQSNEQNLRRLRERQVDLAFVVRPRTRRRSRNLPLSLWRKCTRVSPDHQLARRRSVSLGEAVRERFVAFVREDFSGYHEQLAAVFAKVKGKPRIVEECDSFSSFISAIEAGTGVALVSDAFAYSAGERVKMLRFSPEPKPATLGIAAREGKLSSAAEQFWRCAKQVASQK